MARLLANTFIYIYHLLCRFVYCILLVNLVYKVGFELPLVGMYNLQIGDSLVK